MSVLGLCCVCADRVNIYIIDLKPYAPFPNCEREAQGAYAA